MTRYANQHLKSVRIPIDLTEGCSSIKQSIRKRPVLAQDVVNETCWRGLVQPCVLVHWLQARMYRQDSLRTRLARSGRLGGRVRLPGLVVGAAEPVAVGELDPRVFVVE